MVSDMEEMWADQLEQQKLWHSWENLTQSDRQKLVKELLLGLHEEVAELQRLTDQSRYHILKRDTRLDQNQVAEAGVDVFKYLIALMGLHGVTPDQFVTEFRHKTAVVKSKAEWERSDLSGMNVLLCDLDGCVADWAKGMREWSMAQGTDIDVEYNGVNDPRMEPLKDKFYSMGGFLILEPIPQSIQILNTWRWKTQAKIVLVTARPYRRHRRIYNDTLSWCREVGLTFDHILFESDKASAVRKVQPANIVAFVEDRGKHALEIASTGVKVLKLPHEDPERVEHPNIIHVADWHKLSAKLDEMTPTELEKKQ